MKNKLKSRDIKAMKKTILDRIKALGGDISSVKGKTLMEDLCSITFNTVLYKKFINTPWVDVDEEPIYGLGDFIDENIGLYWEDRESFFNRLYEKYFILTEEPYGQYFWHGEMFTPFQEGSSDFKEWNNIFKKNIYSFKEILSVTNNKDTDFIHLFYGYGYPDCIYVASEDMNLENPTVFGTEHEAWFIEIDNEGDLESYFQNFWTKEELREYIESSMSKKEDYNLSKKV